MARLSITTAWNEASAFVKQEAGPLFLISFGLMALPGIILQVVAPQYLGGMDMAPGTAPNAQRALEMLPIIGLMFIPILLLTTWGNLTIIMLALRRERVIGAAFVSAARRILPLVGASLLVGLAAGLVIAPVFGLLFVNLRSGHLGLPGLLMLLAIVLILAVWIRLMLMTTVAAAEPVGPIAIIRRSWQLTAGHFWKLLGFMLLLMVVYFVVVLVVSALGGVVVVLLAGPPAPGSLSSLAIQLILGVVQAVCLLYFIVLLACIYRQLSGAAESTAQVFN